ncbi:MAG: adenosine kinase [Gammaproteobacteria bacterium]|nr:adenosine kinase [Gammaproteobacteria bacterium]MYF38301.1 adenosine kinase [Gammaproteobacteria bacterium]
MSPEYHLFGIGNALLDTEYQVQEEFLTQNSIEKGRMTLIDSARRNELIRSVGSTPYGVGAGGSVANAIYAAQGFGCRNFFAGVVGEDEVGKTFVDELTQAGIDTLPPLKNKLGKSGQCLIFVTPDGERSMNTSIGIADSFHLGDLPKSRIQSAKFVFVEGYLASSPRGRDAARRVITTAREAGVQTSMTLADVSIVKNFKAALESILVPQLDIVFCNVEEALAWSDANTVEASYETMLALARLCVITLSDAGCIVLERGHSPLHVSGFQQTPIDSNGAGDMFAGAFLTGVVNNWDSYRCARFANFAASKIVTQVGARLNSMESYRELWLAFSHESM